MHDFWEIENVILLLTKQHVVNSGLSERKCSLNKSCVLIMDNGFDSLFSR